MQTKDQFANLRRLTTTTTSSRFTKLPAYKTEISSSYRQIKPTPQVTDSSQSKMRLDTKLTEFDLFRAIQQHSASPLTNGIKDTSNHIPYLGKHARNDTSNAQPGKPRKIKSKTSPSKKNESKLPYTAIQQSKRILTKTQNNGSENCEVKKFAPEMNGLLTDLSSALKTSLYSNQILASASTVTPSKTTVYQPISTSYKPVKTGYQSPRAMSVYQSAKTTARNFDQAKFNMLFGQKSKYSMEKTNRSVENKGINSKGSSPERLTDLHNMPEVTKKSRNNASISTREYLDELKSSCRQTIRQGDTQYQSLSKFLSHTNGSHYREEYLDDDSKNALRKLVQSNFMFEDRNDYKEKYFNSTNTNNKISYKDTIEKYQKKIPDLLPDQNSPRGRKTVITPTPVVKMEVVKGFDELYENAVKNVLSIEVFPDSKESVKREVFGNVQPKYAFDKEIETLMKNFKESEKKSNQSYNFLQYNSNYLFNNLPNKPADNKPRPISDLSPLQTNHISPAPLTVKLNDADFTTNLPYKNTSTRPHPIKPTSNHYISYSLTELIDTNGNKEAMQQKMTAKTEEDNQTLQTDLSWLYTNNLYKTLPPILPTQPTYLHNVFLPYKDHMPKLSTKEIVSDLKISDEVVQTNKDDILKTSTPIPPDSPPSLHSNSSPPTLRLNESPPSLRPNKLSPCLRPSEQEDEEVKNLTKTSRKGSNPNSRRNTPVSNVEKKTKPLKYRPYSLRDRTKASKKVMKLMKELAKEPVKPKYILKEINNESSPKEIFLGELGLRRIIKRVIEYPENNSDSLLIDMDSH